MSSVISAANRKLKGKSGKKLLPSPEESDGAEYGFLGKGGETELKVRAIRNQASDKAGEEEEDLSHLDDRQRSSVKVMLRRDSQSSTETRSNVDSEVNYSDMDSHSVSVGLRQQLYPQKGNLSQFDSARVRTTSASSDSSNKVSTSQGARGHDQKRQGGGRKAVLKPDKDWRSEFARERERIEREHQKALRDYEKEDSTNVEELYRSRDYLREISVVSSKIANFASQRFTDEDSGAVRRPGRSMDSESMISDYSTTSSNNNNTLHTARSDPVFNTKLEIRESPSESESDFVQTLKATFDERLQKVVHQENEEDKMSDKSASSSKAANSDRRQSDGVFVATPYHRSEGQDAYRVRTGSGTYLRNLKQIPVNRTPTGDTSSSAQPTTLTSRFNELSVAPQRSEVEVIMNSNQTSTSSSPTRGSKAPRKTNYFEVTLTLERTGLTSEEQVPLNSAAPLSVTTSTSKAPSAKKTTEKGKGRPQTAAKDTMSIKEQHRENRRRRHTVGGGRDAPEYRKIMEYSTKDSPSKMSAFDRLKPFGKPAKESQPQNMKSWMDSERVRTNSSPNLLASVAMSAASAKTTLSKPKSTSNLEAGKLSYPNSTSQRKESHPQKFSYV